MDRGVAPQTVNANCGLGSLRTLFLNQFTPDRILRGVKFKLAPFDQNQFAILRGGEECAI